MNSHQNFIAKRSSSCVHLLRLSSTP